MKPEMVEAMGARDAEDAFPGFDIGRRVAGLREDRTLERAAQEKRAVFFGAVVAVAPLWFMASLAGAMIGRAIPPDYALDFALPITFLAMVAPMLRSLPHLAAALVAVAAALALAWMPYNLWLPAAALLAMGAGAGVEVMLERKGAA